METSLRAARTFGACGENSLLAQVFGSDFAVPSWPALCPFSARGLGESPNSILVKVVGQAAGKGWVGGRAVLAAKCCNPLEVGPASLVETTEPELRLVQSTDSHFRWWCNCVEALTEELSLLPGPARTNTVEVLSRVWRLLPTYRLRQVFIAVRDLS